MPAGPEPITATRLPVFIAGSSGATQPSSNPRSAIAASIVLIVTGCSIRFSVQDASHGRRADAAGDLGKIVGGVEVLQRAAPVAVVDEVVPVGDLVVDRAAGVAERDAAIHAAGRLFAGAFLAERDHEFAEMPHAIARRLVAPVAAVDLQEARYLTHHSLAIGVGRKNALAPQNCDQQPRGSPEVTPPPSLRPSAPPPSRGSPGGIRPASPSRISAGTPPSSRRCASPAPSRCSGDGS